MIMRGITANTWCRLNHLMNCLQWPFRINRNNHQFNIHAKDLAKADFHLGFEPRHGPLSTRLDIQEMKSSEGAAIFDFLFANPLYHSNIRLRTIIQMLSLNAAWNLKKRICNFIIATFTRGRLVPVPIGCCSDFCTVLSDVGRNVDMKSIDSYGKIIGLIFCTISVSTC